MSYIVCQKKSSNPRVDIRICEKKCDMKNDCEEYISATGSLDISIPISEELPPIQQEAA